MRIDGLAMDAVGGRRARNRSPTARCRDVSQHTAVRGDSPAGGKLHKTLGAGRHNREQGEDDESRSVGGCFLGLVYKLKG